MLPPAVDMVRQLVATPSVSSPDDRFDQSNRGVIDLVAEWASGLGLAVRIETLAGGKGKSNLLATLGEGDEGLVLSGHTDTVPYDADRWTGDPFVLSERDGKLFGLGTADMKGFFAAALHAISRFEPGQLRRPLTLLGTADEESTMDGARALAEKGERLGRYAIIGEPTGLRPIRKHKGVFYVRVKVGGKAGHA
ncbi:MAG: M20/M25/M40 family metallo-hydrolase, partial [Myxococcales bacterium]|nr:M20/M25/M40 family metallo-hydrolase [Myxococcales bacterium]